MEPSSDIEERFAEAVKAALNVDGDVIAPPVGIRKRTPQPRVRRHPSRWHIALFYAALTATVAIIVVVALLH